MLWVVHGNRTFFPVYDLLPIPEGGERRVLDKGVHRIIKELSYRSVITRRNGEAIYQRLKPGNGWNRWAIQPTADAIELFTVLDPQPVAVPVIFVCPGAHLSVLLLRNQHDASEVSHRTRIS